MHIRIAGQGEFDLVKNITKDTIQTIYPHYYPMGSVEFFLGLHNDESIQKDLEQGKVYVLELEDGTAIGTITLDQNEINRFFVLPEYQHQGYGTQTLNYVENELFQKYDMIQLHAALPGKMMYIHRGYQQKEFRKKKVANGDWLCIDILEKLKRSVRNQ